MPLDRPQFARIVGQVPDCRCCGKDVCGVYQWAIFCPGCGKRLRNRRADLRRACANVLGRLQLICFGRFARGRDGGELSALAAVGRTPIVVGYSNALFTLGWRYERGGGASRNLPEAVRCYRKSARLGNLDAMVRLAFGEDTPEPKRVIPLES